MFDQFRGTRAIVFDMRGFPARLNLSTFGSRLVARAGVPGWRIDVPVFAPGVGAYSPEGLQSSYLQNLGPPSKPHYTGRTVMLIQENGASKSEIMGLCLRAAAGTAFVGSPTAGQSGSVMNFSLSGGITVTFTGKGGCWPNGDQVQRVGLKPDVPVRPTKAGLAAGRDEVLEAALGYLDGVAK